MAFQFREWDITGARTVARPHTRLLDLFRAPANLATLRRAVAGALPPGPLRDHAVKTVGAAAHAFNQASEIVDHDPLAQRRPQGGSHARDTGYELHRLNLAFLKERLRFVRNNAELLLRGKSAPDPEPHHMRMFVADSLRPPGLESLNGEGPLWEHLEDRSAPAPSAERFRGMRMPDDEPGVADADRAWDRGNPTRTAEEAIAAYWGENAVESSVLSTADAWREPPLLRANLCDGDGDAAHTRFMRYPEIPRWQHTAGALDGHDRDIEDTLGDGNREMGSHVRRWGGAGGPKDPRARQYVRGEAYMNLFAPRMTAGPTL